jgi:hypothetical protein
VCVLQEVQFRTLPCPADHLSFKEENPSQIKLSIIYVFIKNLSKPPALYVHHLILLLKC